MAVSGNARARRAASSTIVQRRPTAARGRRSEICSCDCRPRRPRASRRSCPASSSRARPTGSRLPAVSRHHSSSHERFGGERQAATCGVNALAAAVSSNHSKRQLASGHALRPGLQGSVATCGIGIVVAALHAAQRHPRQHLRAHPPSKRAARAQPARHVCTERAEIAAVALPRVVAVVVGDRRVRVERLGEREVELTGIRPAPARAR